MKKSIVLIGLTVFALGTSLVSAEEKSLETGAKVGFTESTDVVTPVDPNDPAQPVIPKNPITGEDEEKPGTAGPLSLDYASHFDFGTHKMVQVDETYNAKLQEVKIGADGEYFKTANYAQVTDLRGTLSGWTLSVMQKAQFKSAGTSKDLTGAQLKFNNVSTNTVSHSAAPSVKKSFALEPGVAMPILAADVDQGAGTHVIRFGKDDETTPEESTMFEGVQLFVPGTTIRVKDAYNADLVWTLTDAPGNVLN